MIRGALNGGFECEWRDERRLVRVPPGAIAFRTFTGTTSDRTVSRPAKDRASTLYLEALLMKFVAALLLGIVLLVPACTTRSISDSGYQNSRGYYRQPDNPLYQGELSEFDVLGVDAGADVSDRDIAAAFAATPVRTSLRKGDRIMLIQSGAMIPDEEMIALLERSLSVTVFTGVPEANKAGNASYSKALRMAAAKAGIGTIVVYWGVLESGIEDLATKSVSWVPIVGAAIPDETQSMRIRLKVAVVDVRSGQWEMVTPEVLEDSSVSMSYNRRNSDQSQVATLKAGAYELAADWFAARYMK